MGLCYIVLVVLLMLLVHKSSVSGGVEGVEPKAVTKEGTVHSVPINRRGGVSGGRGGGRGITGGADHGNGDNGGDRTPNTAGVIPIYAAANHHGNNNHHHGAANGRSGSISLAAIVAAILTSLFFTFS
ncbi:uncharacterized protein LOC122087653 [Macadamia integrifolia]|uniref:uncharacterized protein LOC122087653 n=1 Tax=Macadamia integrifolia TaxID=60698 RepID=UPI001C4EA799|nr:uncharacterized protein LOC122087653 [Macadamia integrifolia]